MEKPAPTLEVQGTTTASGAEVPLAARIRAPVLLSGDPDVIFTHHAR